MDIKVNLLSEEDWSRLEALLSKVMFESMVRAFRRVSKEGLLKNWTPIADEPLAATPTAHQPPAAIPTARPPASPPASPSPEKLREKRIKFSEKVKKAIRTVGPRPQGFVTTDDAVSVIKGPSPTETLKRWILDKSVDALIVADYSPPTKGLPGRLMVSRQSVVDREAARELNKTVPVAQRIRTRRDAA